MSRPCTKVGNLTKDPVLKFSDKGTAWVSFTLAVTPWTAKNKRQDKEHPEFYQCRAFRSLAENVAESLSKGDRCIVQGDGEVETFTRADGSEGKAKVILANHVGAELRFATVTINKARRSTTTTEGSSEKSVPEGTDF